MKVFNIEKDRLEDGFSYHLDEKKKINETLLRKSRVEIDDIRRIALWKYDRIIEIDDIF